MRRPPRLLRSPDTPVSLPRFIASARGSRLRARLAATTLAISALTDPVDAQTAIDLIPTRGDVVYALHSNVVSAWFGYVNNEAGSVEVPFGISNFFGPSPPFRGQPFTFLPGVHNAVFSVSFHGGTFAEWTLAGHKVRAEKANMSRAIAGASVTVSSSDSFPSLYVQNGATLTLAAGALGANDGVFLENGTAFRFTGGLLDAPSVVASGTFATFELAHTATSTNPFYLTRTTTPAGASIALSGALKLLHTSGHTVLTGPQAHTGGTELAGGTLVLGSASALGASGTISFTGGSLVFTAANTTDYSARFSTEANQAIRLDTNGQDVLLASALTSSGGSLTKSGAGTLRLSGDNTYSGGTTLHAGTLALESNTALGTGTITLSGGTLRASLAPRTLANNVVFAGDVALGRLTTLTGAIAVSANTTLGAGNPDGLANDTTTLSGAIALDHDLTFVEGTGWGSGGIVLSGAISGSGSLTHATTANLTLTGNNSYSGGTTLNAGTLALGSNTALGSGTLALAGGTLNSHSASRTLANAVTLSGDTTLGGDHALTFTGNWTLARTRELTIANSVTTINGTISGAGRSLNKYGAGELVLTGANTFTGGTYIGEGTVRINNPSGSAFGTGAVTVEAGATLTGAGSFTGALQNNGTLSPGNSPGLMTIGSGSVLAGTTLIELGGLLRASLAEHGVGYHDAIDVGGAGAITFGGTLQVVLHGGFVPNAGDAFDLFNFTSAGSSAFAFLDLPDLAEGLSWNTDLLYTSGTISVTGSAIPEPSTYAALAGFAVLAFALRRRRLFSSKP